jgi:hypothetical protein|tara:strand:- start:219 stop:560 length:342 start_codon:yes stop_codon:yes gene_type:complete
MTSRYLTRQIFANTDEQYDSFFDKRNVNYIEQFNTGRLRYPTPEEIGTLQLITVNWKMGDRYWKYASQYYDGKPELWWVIAWFNQTPTEGSLKLGDQIYIPLPLEKVLEYYGY